MIPRGTLLIPTSIRAIAAAALWGLALAVNAAAEGAQPKVLRYAMRVAETGFDPAQISDLYSATMAANIFDALYEYEFLARLPNGPERMQVMTRMKELTVAYMPCKAHVHRIWTDLAQPWVVGYHRNVHLREFWRYVDIDTAERERRLK